jgi:hypothetical protein
VGEWGVCQKGRERGEASERESKSLCAYMCLMKLVCVWEGVVSPEVEEGREEEDEDGRRSGSETEASRREISGDDSPFCESDGGIGPGRCAVAEGVGFGERAAAAAPVPGELPGAGACHWLRMRLSRCRRCHCCCCCLWRR